jgi:TusA-related sulfurtransferase
MEVAMSDDESVRVHDVDAGDLGCGNGLAAEVRRQLALVGVGDRLRVAARDPAAREDLPALARLLGHRVLSLEHDGGTTTITLERMR